MELSIMRNLYDASLKGCVSTLKTLIQKDPLILSRVSLYPNFETPLHIASLLGHLELCQILLEINPILASEVNSEGHCPLHLASAKGHIEIVKALLSTDAETCFIRDKDDKLPLHFAIMRGRLDVIKELISAMPETEIDKVLTEIDDHGSVLHLCVCYNHLEALKILVESMRGDIDQIVSSKDKEGNTVLDLAVKRGQIKMIKYLISLSDVSDTINTSKSEALRALDMLEHYPRDFISHTIHNISNEERAQTSSNISITQQDHATQPNNFPQQLQINDHEQSQTPSPNIDPPQNQQPSQIIDPPQSLPINDPLVQSPISHPLQLTNPSPHNDPSQPSSHNPSPSNSPRHRQSPSPRNDPSQPSSHNPSPSNSPRHRQSPSPRNDPSQPSSHNPSPSNSPQHPQSPSPHNDPSQPSSHDPSPSNVPLQQLPPFSSSDDPSQPSPTPIIANDPQNDRRTRWDTVEEFCNKYLISKDYWIDKKTREQLMVAATVIATMTFQSVISPPGGVWQEDTTKGGYACPDYGFCEAGTAVVGYVWSPDFLKFIFFNSASFFASLCVLLVLISGLPLHNKVIVWILALLMVVAVTCMLLTYMWALGLVSPNHIFYRIRDLGYILVGIWVFLLFLVCLIQIARTVFWVRSRSRSGPPQANAVAQ